MAKDTLQTSTSRRRKVRSTWITGLAVLTLAVSSACSSNSGGGDSSTASTGGAASASADVGSSGSTSAAPAGAANYKLGYVTDETGAVATFGISMKKGAELAVDEVNTDSLAGPNRTMSIDYVDGAGQPAQNISVMQQFMGDPGVIAGLCCTTSGDAGALKPVVIKGKFPTVIVAAVAEGLNEPPYVYRSATLDSVPGAENDQMIDAVVAKFHPKTVVIATTADSPADADGAKEAAQKFTSVGVKVLKTVNTQTADTDFSGPATQIAGLHPDLVMAEMLANTAPLLIKGLRTAGYTGNVIGNRGMDSAAVYKAGGSAMDGVIVPAPFNESSTDPEVTAFVSAFQKKYGAAPDLFALEGYVAVKYVAAALSKATGTVTRDGLSQALGQVDSLDTPYGTLKFTDGQAAIAKVGLVQFQSGGALTPWPAS
jgi:ABC-type branched-subunit amino acid transport system substrate-binding protein